MKALAVSARTAHQARRKEHGITCYFLWLLGRVCTSRNGFGLTGIALNGLWQHSGELIAKGD